MSQHTYGLLSADLSISDVISEVEVGEAARSPWGSERSSDGALLTTQEAQQELTHSELRLLWRISVEPAFLRSKASRRELWRILLPVLGIGLGALNLLAGSGLAQLDDVLSISGAHESSGIYPHLSCYSDVAMLVLMFLASRLPASSLWSDAFIMLIMGAYGVVCSLLEMPEAMLETKTTASLCADFYRVLAVLAFVSSGVHMCAIGGFLLISASALPMLGAGHELPRLVAGLVAYLLAGVGYLQALNLFRELREASEAARRDSSLKFVSIGVQTDQKAVEPESPTQSEPKATNSSIYNNLDGELVIPEGMRNLTVAARAAQRARQAKLKEAQEKEAKEGKGPCTPMSPPMDTADPEEEEIEVEAQFSLLTDQSAQSAQSASFTPVSFQASSNTRATSSLRYSHSSRGSRLSRISPWSTSSDPEQAQAYLRRPKTTIESGVQTETTNLNVTLCRRCMRPPSLPLTITDRPSAAGSGRSSRTSDRQASQRSSVRSVRSAMRVLGKFTRRPSKNENSEYDAQNYNDATPIVSSFKVTQMLSVSLSLQWAMKHWNMPRIVGSCCPWHTAVMVARRSLEDLDANACDPLWSSLTGWQCTECTCLNHVEVHRCDMCLESKPSSSSGGSSEQPSTFGNTSLDLQSLPSSTQQSALRFAQPPEGDGDNVRPIWSGSSAPFSRRGTSSSSPGLRTDESSLVVRDDVIHKA